MTLDDSDARALLTAARVGADSAAGRAWRLRYTAGLTDREIADALRTRVETVWTLISQASRELKDGR